MFDGQVRQGVGEVGDVVAAVHDDQDLGVARPPVPGHGQPCDDFAELAGGDLGGVVRLAQADRVQESDPGGAAGLQGGDEEYGQPGTNWSLLRSPRR